MVFAVIGPDKKVKMTTSYVECIPDKDILQSMVDAGYTFKLDDKFIKMKDILLYCHNNDPIDNDVETTIADTAEVTTKSFLKPTLNFTPTSRTIYCVETQEIFKTQALAAQKYHLDPAYVSVAVKTGQPYKGYTFKKYLTSQE